MKKEVSLAYMQQNFPELVELAESKLANGTSKERGKAASDMTFYMIARRYIPATSVSFRDMVSGSAPSKPQKTLTVDEEVQLRLSQTSLLFEAKINRWNVALYPEPGFEMPSEVEDSYRQQVLESRANEARRAAMTDSEREEELEELLGSVDEGILGFLKK